MRVGQHVSEVYQTSFGIGNLNLCLFIKRTGSEKKPEHYHSFHLILKELFQPVFIRLLNITHKWDKGAWKLKKIN